MKDKWNIFTYRLIIFYKNQYTYPKL
jgi:hypothetical protein